jgi:hypothetical protein
MIRWYVPHASGLYQLRWIPMADEQHRRTLLVAAGGGGDALASLLMSGRLLPVGHPIVVASYSWDRRILDPLPGPRSAADFEEAHWLTPKNLEVTANSRLRSGGLSTLGLLAKTTAVRFVLLDPYGGATGMREQLAQLVESLSFESAVLVDVGGDVLATGAEAELRSPLADSLSLAALADFPVPVDVVIAGPGLDGELSPSYVRSRCVDLGGSLSFRLRIRDIAPWYSALAQLPTEATTLLAAAALGITGRAEIRDDIDTVSLSDDSSDTYLLPISNALSGNQLAQKLISTHSLAEAEAAALSICGRSELSYERLKAAKLRSAVAPSVTEMRRRLEDYWVASLERNVTLATFRRVAEIMKLTRYDADLIRSLVGAHAHRQLALCQTSADEPSTGS